MRRRRHHSRRRLIAVFLILSGTLILLVRLDLRARPLVQEYGCTAARRAAMLAVHYGVEKVLSEENPSYSQLVKVDRNEDGHILSVEADVLTINRLKAAASNAVMQELAAREKESVSIPLGNLIGGAFFTGRGPFLKVPFRATGVVITTLSDKFSDAGINQTCHQLYLNMTVTMTAALPLERTSLEVSTGFLICETVLVGEVPESYTCLNLGENSSLGKIFGADD